MCRGLLLTCSCFTLIGIRSLAQFLLRTVPAVMAFWISARTNPAALREGACRSSLRHLCTHTLRTAGHCCGEGV